MLIPVIWLYPYYAEDGRYDSAEDRLLHRMEPTDSQWSNILCEISEIIDGENG